MRQSMRLGPSNRRYLLPLTFAGQFALTKHFVAIATAQSRLGDYAEKIPNVGTDLNQVYKRVSPSAQRPGQVVYEAKRYQA